MSNLGKDAIISVLLRYLHSSKDVRDKFSNTHSKQRLDNYKVFRLEMKEASQKDQLCCVVTHDGFLNKKLHAVKWYAKVCTEGDPQFFFDNPIEGNTSNNEECVDDADGGGDE